MRKLKAPPEKMAVRKDGLLLLSNYALAGASLAGASFAGAFLALMVVFLRLM